MAGRDGRKRGDSESEVSGILVELVCTRNVHIANLRECLGRRCVCTKKYDDFVREFALVAGLWLVMGGGGGGGWVEMNWSYGITPLPCHTVSWSKKSHLYELSGSPRLVKVDISST